MPKYKSRYIDVFYLTHPNDCSLRYVGVTNTGNLPQIITNSEEYKLWLNKKRPDFNIIDHVLQKESKFWEEYYSDLFSSWGFNLIRPEMKSLNSTKSIIEIRKLIQLSIVSTENQEFINENTNSISDLENLIIKLDELSKRTNQINSQVRIIKEIHLLLAMVLFNGQSMVLALKYKFNDLINATDLYTMNQLLPVNTYVENACLHLFKTYPSSPYIFFELNKMASRKVLHERLPTIVNNLSIYFGLTTRLTNQYSHVFGKLLYTKTKGIDPTVEFLCQYYNCESRLELLCKLRLPCINAKCNHSTVNLYLT